MSASKNKGPVFDPGLCRCCGTMKKCRVLTAVYEVSGEKEVYADMFIDSFGLMMSHLDGKPTEQLICASCVHRLRDATAFKKQVQLCEEAFLEMKMYDAKVEGFSPEMQLFAPTKVEVELVKAEPRSPSPLGDRDDDPMDHASDPEPSATAAPIKAERKDRLKEPGPRPSKASRPAVGARQRPPTGVINDKSALPQKADEQRLKSSVKLILPEGADDKDTIIKQATILLKNADICPFKWSKNRYHCFYCNAKFTDPLDLRLHNNTHKPNAADIRNATSKFKQCELVKVDTTNIVCKLCGSAITNMISLKMHLFEDHQLDLNPKSSGGVVPFRFIKSKACCGLCPKEYDDFFTVNRHMNVHYQNFVCKICGAGFMTPTRLRIHVMTHETGSHPCEECNKTFRSLQTKREHYNQIHKNVGRHRCPRCEEAFMNYYQRNKHVSTVHGLKLKEYKCSICDREFSTSGKLTHHKEAVHLKIKRFGCNVCEWKFYSKSELKKHKLKHTFPKKFQCRVCLKKFGRKCTLHEHMRIHKNDRRFQCDSCGRTFTQKCSLKYHVQVHHPATVAETQKVT